MQHASAEDKLNLSHFPSPNASLSAHVFQRLSCFLNTTPTTGLPLLRAGEPSIPKALGLSKS